MFGSRTEGRFHVSGQVFEVAHPLVVDVDSPTLDSLEHLTVSDMEGRLAELGQCGTGNVDVDERVDSVQ